MKKIIATLLSISMLFAVASCKRDAISVPDNTGVLTSETSKTTTTTTEIIDDNPQATVPPNPYLDAINPYITGLDSRYYLSEEEWDYFVIAVDAMLNHEERVDLTDDYDSNLRILGALMHNPYYFLVEDVDFYKDHTGFIFDYKYDEAEHKAKIKFVDDKMMDIINSIMIEDDMNALDKVLAVNKYFAENIAYDYEWLAEFELSTEQFLFPDSTIYEALEDGYGVCHTYTYLDLFVFYQIGIEAVSKTSEMLYSDGGHMWTVARIGDEYYHIDTTWSRLEEPDDDGNMVVHTSLKYFGMTSDERIESGVDYYEIPTDNYYGNIEMNDTRFADLHNAYDYELLGDHKVKLYENTPDGTVERIINTEDYLY